MREILFRGKRIDNGEWIQGFLVIWGNDYYIAPDINAYTSMGGRGKGRCMMFGHYYQVFPKTVGQYTGLTDKTDKNGRKIFEGDIIRQKGFLNNYYTSVWYASGRFLVKDYETLLPTQLGGISRYKIEVIGNIHDNPELLEVTE